MIAQIFEGEEREVVGVLCLVGSWAKVRLPSAIDSPFILWPGYFPVTFKMHSGFHADSHDATSSQD